MSVTKSSANTTNNKKRQRQRGTITYPATTTATLDTLDASFKRVRLTNVSRIPTTTATKSSAGELCLQRDWSDLMMASSTTTDDKNMVSPAWISTSTSDNNATVLRHAWRPCRLIRQTSDCLRLEILQVVVPNSTIDCDDASAGSPCLIRMDLTFGRRYPHQPPKIKLLDTDHRHHLRTVVLEDNPGGIANDNTQSLDDDTAIIGIWSPIRRLSELLEWLLDEYQDRAASCAGKKDAMDIIKDQQSLVFDAYCKNDPRAFQNNNACASASGDNGLDYAATAATTNEICHDNFAVSGNSFLAPNPIRFGAQGGEQQQHRRQQWEAEQKGRVEKRATEEDDWMDL